MKPFNCSVALACLMVGLTIPHRVFAEPVQPLTIIHAQALHAGRINARLFGNFIELLDDVVPGLWAEMLNDRSFEGVERASNSFYYDGSPNSCDREWDRNPTWTRDSEYRFNGERSARLTATRRRPASLTQSGLAVKRGMTYLCTGWF